MGTGEGTPPLIGIACPLTLVRRRTPKTEIYAPTTSTQGNAEKTGVPVENEINGTREKWKRFVHCVKKKCKGERTLKKREKERKRKAG